MKHLVVAELTPNMQRRFFTVVLPDDVVPFKSGEDCLVRTPGEEPNFKGHVSNKRIIRLSEVDDDLASRSLGPQTLRKWNKRAKRWTVGTRAPRKADLIRHLMASCKNKSSWKGASTKIAVLNIKRLDPNRR